MNTFNISLALEDSKGTDLKQWLSFRSHSDGRLEIILVSLPTGKRITNDEKQLGIVHLANLARSVAAVQVLHGASGQ